jgi:hypothetical protein
VPSDWNNGANTIRCLGGGQSGINVAASGGGGIGGDYSEFSNLALTIGAVLSAGTDFNVGTGGAGTASLTTHNNGTSTWIKDNTGTTQCLGKGAGSGDTAIGGVHTGGTPTSGGGGAAGPAANGSNGGAGIVGGAGDGGAGGAGGATGGANGGTGSEWGSTGPGGGGAGSLSTNGGAGGPGAGGGGSKGHNGGAGGDGLLVIEYTPLVTYTFSATAGAALAAAFNEGDNYSLDATTDPVGVSASLIKELTDTLAATLAGTTVASALALTHSYTDTLVATLADATVNVALINGHGFALAVTTAGTALAAAAAVGHPNTLAATLADATLAAALAGTAPVVTTFTLAKTVGASLAATFVDINPSGTQIILTDDSTPWTVPSDCLTAKVECIGGGRGGRLRVPPVGVAGGDYARVDALSLTPGDVISYQIGEGGEGSTTTDINDGGDTWFVSPSTVLARGGGSGATSVGDITYAGGAGAAGGGSGGAGGPGGAGQPGVTATNAGGAGGAGAGGAGGTAFNNGAAGTEWGSAGSGGGGGAGNATTAAGNGGLYGGAGGSSNTGVTGDGAQGVIVITYIPIPQETYSLATTTAGASVAAAIASIKQLTLAATLAGASVAAGMVEGHALSLAKTVSATLAATLGGSGNRTFTLAQTLADTTLLSAVEGLGDTFEEDYDLSATLASTALAATVAPGISQAQRIAAATAAANADGGYSFHWRLFNTAGVICSGGVADGTHPIPLDTDVAAVASVSKSIYVGWACQVRADAGNPFTITDWNYCVMISGYDTANGRTCDPQNPNQTVDQCLATFGSGNGADIGLFSYDSMHLQKHMDTQMNLPLYKRSDMAVAYRTLYGITGTQLVCSSPMPAGGVQCSYPVLTTIAQKLMDGTLTEWRRLLDDPAWVPVEASEYFPTTSVVHSPIFPDEPWHYEWGLWIEPVTGDYWMAGSFGTVVWIKHDYSMAGIVFRTKDTTGGEVATQSITTMRSIRDSYDTGTFETENFSLLATMADTTLAAAIGNVHRTLTANITLDPTTLAAAIGGAHVPSTQTYTGAFAVAGTTLQASLHKQGVQTYAVNVHLDNAALASAVSVGSISVGDTLTCVMPDGTTQSRTITSIIGGRTLHVTTPFTVAPLPQSVWLVEKTSLVAQQFRIVSVSEDSTDDTGAGMVVSVTAAAVNQSKYDAIDLGTPILTPPISVVPPSAQAAPSVVILEAFPTVHQVSAGTTLFISWASTPNAVKYTLQYRKDNGNWITLPPQKGLMYQLNNVLAGLYTARVAAVNASGIGSVMTTSEDLLVPDQTDPSAVTAALGEAVTEAAAAAAAASAALATIASDNNLSKTEKTTVVTDYNVIIAEKSGIDAQADAWGTATEKTAYDNAITALTAYLATLTTPVAWNNMSGNTTIVGTTFRSKFQAVWTTKSSLLDAIYNRALIQNQVSGMNSANILPSQYTYFAPGANLPLIIKSSPPGTHNYISSAFGDAAGGSYLAFTSISTYTQDATRFAPSGSSFNLELYPGKYIVSFYAVATSLLAGLTNVDVGFMYEDGTYYFSPGFKVGAGNNPSTRYSAVIDTSAQPTNAKRCHFFIRANRAGLGDSTSVIYTDRFMVEKQQGGITAPSHWVPGPSQLDTKGSGSKLGDQNNLLPINWLGVRSLLTATPISYTYNTATPASIVFTCAACTFLGGSAQVSYSTASVTKTQTRGTTQTWYFYFVDPYGIGGSQTLIATTDQSNLVDSDGVVYIGSGDVTIPASGSGSGSGGGGGGGYCVGEEMWLTSMLQAKDAVPGYSVIDCIDLPTSAGKHSRTIQGLQRYWGPRIRLITDRGAAWIGGLDTPFDLPSGETKLATEMLGQSVVTDWGMERVISATLTGDGWLVRINVGGVSYMAGGEASHRVASHNSGIHKQ